ncbi:MAG TPA: Maf family protein [Candidatus Limnocylindria bacterium]|nr:Maf family protein [Candidatus Limnocylindria bacterium]
MLRLASGSPRRIELVSLLGIPFEAVEPGIDESAHEDPAIAKAEACHVPGEVTLGADTLIDLDGERIGKPADAEDAKRMLRLLAGRDHVVRTSVMVIGAAGRRLRFAVRSRVRTREPDDARIEAYVATGEPLGKAGAYAIQGAGADLITGYDGCYANIVGLPICHAYFALRRMGVVAATMPEPAFAARFGFECPAYRCAYAQGRALRDGAEYASWSERV